MTTTNPTISARWRIVGWVVLVTTIVIATLIFTVRQVLIHDVSAQANAQTVQEIGEFRTFAEQGVNPDTGAPFTSSADMLQTYISRQYSSYSEQLIGVTDRQIIYLKQQDDHATQAGYRLHQDMELLSDLGTRAENSGIENTPAGKIHWGRVDITIEGDPSQNNKFIVAEYIQPPSTR